MNLLTLCPCASMRKNEYFEVPCSGAQLPSELWVLMGINAGAFKLDVWMGRTRLWQM
jgi:hypothetical protein